ncbi:hypothetical protein [Pseudoalteromonas sp.]|uniref:hypothetical protein n=1 Tax=Pseudoalteromonas sp. TaxID=53249 RepID=UPI0035C735A5
MFNLAYKNERILQQKHKDWCLKNSPLPLQNPQPENDYHCWLYQYVSEVYTLSPESMLEKISSLFKLISGNVTSNNVLFTLLSEQNFLFWERNQKTEEIFFVFSWPDSPLFIELKQLLGQRSSRRSNASLETILNNLNIRNEVTNAVSGSQGDTLFQRVKKQFQKDGVIKLLVSSFMNSPQFDEFEKFCVSSFDYQKYSRQRAGWGPYPQINMLENTVCPYCNRSYTHSVFEGDVYGGRPELDHFLSKSVFPFFALSVFNLIPVCHSCNHAKLDKHVVRIQQGAAEYTHLHPNLAGDNVNSIKIFKTRLEGDLINYILSNDYSLKGAIEVTEDCRARTKVKNSLEIYNLAFESEDNKLIGYYADHYKDIERTLSLIKRYPISAINTIAELVNEDADTLQRLFIENLISDAPWEEPLGKLRNDLLGTIINSLEANAIFQNQ